MKELAIGLLALAFGLYGGFKIREGIRHRYTKGWGDLICACSLAVGPAALRASSGLTALLVGAIPLAAVLIRLYFRAGRLRRLPYGG